MYVSISFTPYISPPPARPQAPNSLALSQS